ncbi:MAG: 1-acyl-sn-glycerol-3-phosphate acyltransferase [Deltaproteobacteria bacterium]|nr:1-acyl-sn-glycerol-3-phosphate acyltransferase [Deltaproteobacteria bacterium]
MSSSDSEVENVPKTRVLDWIATLPFAVCFILLLIAMDPIHRVGYFFGAKVQDSLFIALNKGLVALLRILNARIAVEKSDKIDPNKQYIIVSNHQSLFDIPIIASILARNNPKFIAKKELGQWIPSVSFVLRRGRHALIDRSDAGSAVQSISQLGTMMQRSGFSMVIFPEGTRARDGKLKKFRSLGLNALIKASPDCQVLPVTIDGSWKLAFYNFMPIPRGVVITIKIGDPILHNADVSASALSRMAGEIIAKNIKELHSQHDMHG